MNDTHGVEGKGWYGFDLDGTLAKYDKWEGIDNIGEPVKPMVDLMKRMHAEGKVVKILTARVAPRSNVETEFNPYLTDKAVYDAVGRENEEKYADVYRKADWMAYEFIADWCIRNLGFLPEITHEKDSLMLELYDDRVKQVVPNEGLLVEDLFEEARSRLRKVHADNGWLLAKLESKRNGFWAGFMLSVLLTSLVQIGCVVYDGYFAEKTPDQVRMKQAHDALCDLLREWPVDWTSVDETNTNGVYRLEAR